MLLPVVQDTPVVVHYGVNKGDNFMANINWSFSTPVTDVNIIDLVESNFTISIPDELRELILKHNGGYPSLSRCNIPGFGETDFKMLLSYNEDDDESIFDVMDYFVKKYHKRVIPFASDSGSGYFCVKDDYIVYVAETIDSPIPICENINQLLNNLF